MSLAQFQRDQKQRLDDHLKHLTRVLSDTERARDLAPSPKDRERHEGEVGTLKADIDRYKQELASVEDEIHAAAVAPATTPPRNPPYRVDLDDKLPDDEQQRLFRVEVEAIAAILDYTIEGLAVPDGASAALSVFVGVKPGDFNVMRCLFGTTCNVVGETEVAAFRALRDWNRARLDPRDAILVTNTYIAPAARQLARASSIQILTFEELLDKVFQLTPYLQKHLEAYETDALFQTYVDVRYLRRGQGEYPDAHATREETLVTATKGSVVHADGVAEAISTFETKGELTPYIDAWVRASGGGQICVLGDYGTGKTSFAKQYFWRAATAYLQDPVRHRIPLLVPLNRYHTSTDVEQMMTGFLVNECNTRRTFDSFLRLAALGKFLVILDGFDEMAKQVDLNVRRRNFRELAKLVVGRNKVILLGRPNYFLTQEEIAQVFTADEAAGDPYRRALQSAVKPQPRYDVLRLTLFDRWQIEEFLKRQSGFLKRCGIDDWRDLRQTIARTYNLEELARTPVLLDIIIKTLSKLRTQVSEINAAKLYEIYTDHWLNEEYAKGDVRWLITREDKELFMLDLAWSMLTTDGRPEIHFSQLSRRVQKHFNLARSTEIEYFSSDIRFCGYLVHSETDGTYRFVHKSFMEYFCARRLVQRVMTEGQVATVATASTLPEEVFFFLCQLAGNEGVERVMALAREQNDAVPKAFAAQLGTRMLRHFIEKDRQRANLAAVEQRVSRLLEYCTEFDDPRGYLWGLMTLGRQLVMLGRFAEAQDSYERALKIARQLNDRPSVRRVMLEFGRIDESRSEYESAIRRYEAVLETLDRDDDPADRCTALIAMGKAYARTESTLRARELFEQARLVAQSLDDRAVLARTLELIADTHERAGEYVAALDQYRRAIALHNEASAPRLVGLALMGVANIYWRMGQPPEAFDTAQQALVLFRDVEDMHDQASAEILLARVHISLDEAGAAEARLSDAIQHSTAVGDIRQEAEASLLLGEVFRQTARQALALELQTRALESSRRLGDQTSTLFSLIAVSGTLAGLQRLDEARTTFEHAVSELGHIRDARVFIDAASGLGTLSAAHGWWNDARRMYIAALEISRERSLLTDEASLLEALGGVETEAGDGAAADRFYDEAAQLLERLRLEARVAQICRKRAALARTQRKWKPFVELYRRYRTFAEANGLALSGDLEEEYRRLDADSVAESAFDLHTPVQTPDRFWGRRIALQSVMRCVGSGVNVALTGDRGMGKSSLLSQVRALIQPPHVPVLVNIQAFPAQTEVLLEGILREVATRLARPKLIGPDAELSRIRVNYASDFSRALRSLMEEAADRLPDVRLVLLLDEADVLLASGAGPALSEALTDRTPAVAILSMSRTTRPSAEKTDFHSWMRDKLNIVELGPLAERELKDGLRAALTRVGITIDEDALRLAYSWSGGIPWVAQSIGHHAAIHARQQSRSSIGPDGLTAIRASVADKTAMVLESIFATAGDNEQTILKHLAMGRSWRTWDGSPGLAALTRRGILTNYPPRLASALFEDWIRAHATG